VYLPKGEQWALDLVNQLVGFPAGTFDDKVDVCTGFARMINKVWAARGDNQKDKPRQDRWDRAFNDDDGEDDWKLA
jgi:hypothetical protein